MDDLSTLDLSNSSDSKLADTMRPTAEVVKEIYSAMLYMYKLNLDKASEKNDIGYQQCHNYMNERFLKFQKNQVMSPKEFLDSVRVLQTYRNTQIPWFTVTSEELHFHLANINARYLAVQKTLIPTGTVEMGKDGLIVKVEYHSSIVNDLKYIQGRKVITDRNGKFSHWLIPPVALPILVSLFPDWQYSFSIKNIARYSRQQIEELSRINQIWYTDGQFRFNMPVGKDVRARLFYDGFSWNKELSCWYCEATWNNAVFILSDFKLSFHESFEEKYFELLNRRLYQISVIQKVQKIMPELLERKYAPIGVDTNLMIPRKFQKESIHWKVQKLIGHIDAHDMGLGKTFMSLLTALAVQLVTNCKVIIVCPAIVIEQWKQTAASVGVSCSVYSWAKIPEPLNQDYLLIADEAHKMQDYRTKQSRSLARLAKSALFVQLLTGTPCKNGRIENIHPLLEAVQWPGARSFTSFKEKYEDRYERLKADTAGKVVLYKHKKECIDLPPLTRQYIPVEFSKKDEELYAIKYKEFMDRYFNRVQEGIVSGEVEFLVAAMGMRLANSIGKASAAIELAEEILDQGEQLVLFAEFVETLQIIYNNLCRKYRTYWIKSGTSRAEREEAREKFLAGELDLIMCTTKTGGVGLNLQSASYVMLVDRPWTPGDTFQGEDRVNRMGQKNPVTSLWLQHGIDTEVDAVLQTKQDNINQMLGSDVQL